MFSSLLNSLIITSEELLCAMKMCKEKLKNILLSVHPPLYFVMGVLRLENNLKKHTDAP
jgi:hypothetical protein